MTRETLERNTTLQSGRGLNIDEIGRCRNNLRPEVRGKGSSDHHCTSSLKKMTMLTFSHAILSMRTGTRELSKGALLSQNTTQVLGDILTSRVNTKRTNRHRVPSKNHGYKALNMERTSL